VTRSLSILMLVIVVAGPGARGVATCPEGRSVVGDLGINQLLCIGGDCTIYGRIGDGLTHQFTTEPRLYDVDLRGPSAGLVKEGDVLVAVDGLLVTTPEGGYRLANLKARTLVQLWLRRDGRDVRVSMTTREGCGFRSLTVRAGGSR
jgi:hypothetical protein